MIGAAIAAGTGLASSIFGGIKARKAAKKQRKILNQLNTDNENMFFRDYYTDFMDDPSSRSYLKRLSEDFYDKDKSINSSGIATGATHENVQAQKAAANRAMGDAINNVVVNNEARKEAAKNRYISRKDAIAQGKTDLAQQEAQNWTNLGNNLSDSVTSLASTYLGSGGKLFGGYTPGSATLNQPAIDTMNKGMNQYKMNYLLS